MSKHFPGDDDDIIAAAREGFLEEAQDNLRQFEQGLLAMEQDPGDAEAVNSAFRAAHTIKGGAGLFGFQAVVGFTHEVESVLDRMRDGLLAVTEPGMALLLQGRDQMERLVHAVRDGTEGDAELEAISQRLGEQLRQLRGESAGPAAPASATAAPEDIPASNGEGDGVWHLSLRLGVDALRNGLDPMSFIRYLDTLGEVEGIRTLAEAVPELLLLDPEGCCLGFEIRLRSPADRQTIVDVFEFLQDDCELEVLAPDASAADYQRLLAQRAADEPAREALLAHWQALGMARLLEAPEPADSAPPTTADSPEPAATSVAPRPAAAPPRAEERRGGARDRRAGGEESRFIRVRADKLDHLIDLIGELVIASSGAQVAAQQERSTRFGEAAQRIHDLVQEARDGALGLRMVPIGETFSRFQRVVRDVSKELGKDVALQITGGDTELDKSMVETIADPLMHLVRNSLDHGLETAEDREAAGKPGQGTLALHAYHESGNVIIEVSDDGRGLNRDRILAKAVERELVSPDSVLDDEQVYRLIFEPGFSTAAQVTNLSGRGVGMDVVKRNVESLRGQIKVASTPGRGATMQIRLPLTLAIIDGFLTQVAGVSYVLPLESVAECIETPPGFMLGEHGACGCFDLRGEVVPYIDLRRSFGHDGPRPTRQSLIVVHSTDSRIGLLVDRLLGEYQTVIKPLGSIFQHLEGIAGSTILGSGEVALILDVPSLERLQIRQPRHLATSPIHTSRTAHPSA
ncbi:CheA signal transduction histidine kinase [Sphaerotilus natans subsp. natans DSM 6575]|uniref:Chemotaxis protein CheA n=1 Tax=Sphaerotilus natans subsp. natans DSM 6575 TaxID=1286631 RepID=A0A059KNV6_9BURK|nr:chemotaxis protein CheA [Sphaerotilus natans]KDB53167.1 CheA signal transduction histidine kinase [Sphaerotilus natans subsp. natans DSM 6575]SIR19682.1 two-component system, chemotaxis family, sensor kinase CheA [Sphaerotilus natans]